MIRFFLSHSDDETIENRRLLGTKILPNILTIAALCIGLTALQSGIEGRFTNAMLLILVAAVLDGVDGMVARLLKASSPFGAELDRRNLIACRISSALAYHPQFCCICGICVMQDHSAGLRHFCCVSPSLCVSHVSTSRT
jgi:hypothetical protein